MPRLLTPKLIATVACFVVIATSPAQGASTKQELNPKEFRTAIEWMQAVHKSSRSSGWAAMRRTLTAVGSFGISEVDLATLPAGWGGYGDFQFKNFVTGEWYRGPYAREAGSGEATEAKVFIAAALDYCRAHDGTVVYLNGGQNNFACEAKEIQPWYLAAFTTDGRGVGKGTIVQSADQRELMSLAVALGYRAAEERLADEIEATARRNAALEAEALAAQQEAERQIQEAPLRRQIGSRICRAEDGLVYVGFVEGKSPDADRVQIRVVDALLQGKPGLRPGGFESSIIWDAPDRWSICS